MKRKRTQDSKLVKVMDNSYTLRHDIKLSEVVQTVKQLPENTCFILREEYLATDVGVVSWDKLYLPMH